MRSRFLTYAWILVACALFSSSPKAVCAQSTRLYVGNSIADNISVIDLNSLKVIGDIIVGPQVHGMAVQADGCASSLLLRATVLFAFLTPPPASSSASSN